MCGQSTPSGQDSTCLAHCSLPCQVLHEWSNAWRSATVVKESYLILVGLLYVKSDKKKFLHLIFGHVSEECLREKKSSNVFKHKKG